MADRPYHISTHEPWSGRRCPLGLAQCTAPGCVGPAYAVTERGRQWDGMATCERHADGQLWAALVKANEGP